MIDDIKKLIESNSNYWEKRALENKLNIIENELDYVRRLESIYKEANKQIEAKLAVVYQRYAKENKMTLEQAYKRLPAAIQKEYKNDVMDYTEKARQHQSNPKWRQYLLNQSLMHQHSVLDYMRTEYRNVIYNIDMENTNGKFLEKIYANANYYAQYTAEQGNKGEQPFATVSKERIQSLLEENWTGGGNFSQNIWKNKELLVKALDDIVIKGLAVGDGYDKMAKELSKRMDTGFNNARRLIMTESARMDNAGLLDWYKESGVEQLIFVATLDMKTSEICRAMDGTIINLEDAKMGLNVPPLHPYCRSVISPYYDFNEVTERVYKDSKGKSQTGDNRTYSEYLEEEYADFEQAKAITEKRNTIANLVKSIGTISKTPIVSQPITSNIRISNPDVGSISNEEQRALNRMVSGSSWVINDKLKRDMDLTIEERTIMANLDKALQKMPIYQGEVNRDIDVMDLESFLIDYELDKVIKFKQFLSTSTLKTKYNSKPNVIYKIKSKTGRDIRKYNKGESEILFERNSKFLIQKIEVKKGIVYITLEQMI